MEEQQYTLTELSAASGVPVRTIRYYIQKRVLPGPSGRGPNSRYDEAHLQTLEAIRRLQEQELTLEDIRKVLERLHELQYSPQSLTFMDDEKLGAIRRLAGRMTAPPSSLSAQENLIKMLWSAYAVPDAQRLESGATGPARHAYGDAPARRGERSTWERITLTTSIELHVRRPLPARQRKGLEQLLEAARRVFGEPDERADGTH